MCVWITLSVEPSMMEPSGMKRLGHKLFFPFITAALFWWKSNNFNRFPLSLHQCKWKENQTPSILRRRMTIESLPLRFFPKGVTVKMLQFPPAYPPVSPTDLHVWPCCRTTVSPEKFVCLRVRRVVLKSSVRTGQPVVSSLELEKHQCFYITGCL